MCLDRAILRYYVLSGRSGQKVSLYWRTAYISAFWPERVCYAYGYAYTKSQPPTGHSDTLWIEWKHPWLGAVYDHL